MITPDERAFFLEHGYLHARNALEGEHLALIQSEFDRVWELEKPPVSQHKLLKHRVFIDLISHPPILERHQAIFGAQTQLLQYDLLRQGPRNTTTPDYAWHRDFTMRGDFPLSINTILYLNDVTEAVGPTRVVPGSHLGTEKPAAAQSGGPLEGQVAVYAKAGDVVFINSAIWHTGGRNQSDGLRRGIYLYYGYWWLKRYESDRALPWQALENADETRLRLLGVKMPAGDIHMY